MRTWMKVAAPLAAAAVLLLSAPRSLGAEPPPIVVGALFPLTGTIATGGQTSAQGVQLAVDEINASGGIKSMGGAKIKLALADSTSDPAAAADATARLIDDQHPIAIVGSYASGLSITVSQAAERRGIPFVTMSFSDELTSRGFKNVFQITPKASVIGTDTLQYASQLAQRAGQKLNDIAIVYENTPYGTAQATGLKKEADKEHVNVVLFEEYPQGLTDATPLVQKIVAAKPQVIFPMSLYTDAVLLIRGLAQRNYKVQMVGGSGGFVIPAFYQAAGALSNGVMSMNSSNYDTYGAFEKQYFAKYKTFAPHEAYENGVCMFVIAAALEASKATTSDALRPAIAALNVKGGPFAGMPGGGIKFDATGLNVLAYPIMVQWNDAQLVTIWPQAKGTAGATWAGKPMK